MSVRFVSPDLEPVFMVYFLCPISRDYASFYITIQPRLTIFGLHIDHGGYMPEGHVSLNIESFFIFYLRQVFVIRTVSLLPYNIGSQSFVQTLMMEGRCLYLSIRHLKLIFA